MAVATGLSASRVQRFLQAAEVQGSLGWLCQIPDGERPTLRIADTTRPFRHAQFGHAAVPVPLYV